MRYLFLDDCANVTANIVKGLRAKGMKADYINRSMGDNADIPSNKLKIGEHYDVVVISYPYHVWKLMYYWLVKPGKLVVFWHGSDAKQYHKRKPIKDYLRKKADLNVTSSHYLLDIIPEAKWLGQCLDTEMFKPMKDIKKREEVFEWGK